MTNNKEFVEEEHAKIYSVFRPDIPSEVAEKIVSYLGEKFHGLLDTAVDVGCGSGQSTLIFAPFFEHVYGFDASRAQIAEAEISRIHPKVKYCVSDAEKLPLSTNSVQLVTAGASLHWFDTKVFFEEVRRILVPEGVFVAYTYHKVCPVTKCPQMTKEVDKLYEEIFYTIKPYWPDEVHESLERYRNIVFPFEEVIRDLEIRQPFKGTLSDVVGFIKSFSAYQNLKKRDERKSTELLLYFYKKLQETLQLNKKSEDSPIELYRDIFIIMCRKRIL